MKILKKLKSKIIDIFDYIKYGIIEPIYNFFRYKLPYFIRNIWFFRKELYEFRSWDYTYNLQFLKRTLERTLICLENGNEVEESRLVKVNKIKRAVELLNNKITDNYIEQSEKILDFKLAHKFHWNELANGNFEMIDELSVEQKQKNMDIYELSQKIEEEQWEELWSIIKGSDEIVLVDNEEVYDTGMRGWWS